MTEARREALWGWLLVLPALLFLVAFTYWPTLETAWVALHTTPVPGHPSRLAPAVNFAAMTDDPIFWQVLRNNFYYAVALIPATMALALTMALAVNGRIPGRSLLRLAYFTPTVLPMIAVANIWLFFFTTSCCRRSGSAAGTGSAKAAPRCFPSSSSRCGNRQVST